MKSVLIALLLVATLLFVAAEPRRRGGKGKPGKGPRPKPWQNKECPRNCSDCQEGTCLECDDDFALKTITLRRFKKFNKTMCVPCSRPLKRKDPDTFLQQCVTECPRNCSSCENGSTGSCETCDDGFFNVETRLLKRKICVPCGRKMKKNWPEVFARECRENECPRNCSSCENGSCETCEDGFFNVETRLLKRKICVPCGRRMKKSWPEVFARECRENGSKRLNKKQRKGGKKNMSDPF